MVPLHLSFPAGRLRSRGNTPLGAAHDSRISDTYSTALAVPTRLSRSVLQLPLPVRACGRLRRFGSVRFGVAPGILRQNRRKTLCRLRQATIDVSFAGEYGKSLAGRLADLDQACCYRRLHLLREVSGLPRHGRTCTRDGAPGSPSAASPIPREWRGLDHHFGGPRDDNGGNWRATGCSRTR
jgi:hypothetical protein